MVGDVLGACLGGIYPPDGGSRWGALYPSQLSQLLQLSAQLGFRDMINFIRGVSMGPLLHRCGHCGELRTVPWQYSQLSLIEIRCLL